MEAFRQILSQLNATFSNLSLGKKLSLITLIIGFAVGFFFLMTWSGKSEFQPLYAQLDPSVLYWRSQNRKQSIRYSVGCLSDGVASFTFTTYEYSPAFLYRTSGLRVAGRQHDEGSHCHRRTQ